MSSKRHTPLEYVHLIDIGPFGDTKVPLEPVTVLVGANGTGKSTVLNAIARYGNHDWLAGASGGRPMRAVAFKQREHADPREFGVWGSLVGMGPHDPITDDDSAGGYKRLLAGYQFFDHRSERMCTQGSIGLREKLGPFYANLISVLDDMKDRDDGSFGRVQQLVTELVPQIAGLGLRPVGQGSKQIVARHVDGAQVSFDFLSTGTQYLIALSTFVVETPGIWGLLLEEPEVGFHPGIIGRIVDSISSLVTSDHCRISQIIMTTHSPWVYSRFENHPESVVILEHKNDRLQANRLSDMEDYERLFTSVDFLGGVVLPGDFTEMRH